VLAAALPAPVPAVVFGLAPDADDFARVPAAVRFVRVLAAVVDPFVAGGGAAGVPSAEGAAPSGPVSGPPARPRPVAVLARDRLPVRAWPPVPAGDLRAERPGAGPVPVPAELSLGIPFSAVTAP
jgi:hypothetical protein